MRRKKGKSLKQFRIPRLFFLIVLLVLIVLVPPANMSDKINLERLQKILEWTLADSGGGESLDSMLNSEEPLEVPTNSESAEITKALDENTVVVNREPGKHEGDTLAKHAVSNHASIAKMAQKSENVRGGKTSKTSKRKQGMKSSGKIRNEAAVAPSVGSNAVEAVEVENTLSEFQKTLAQIQNSLKELEKSKMELEKLHQQYCDKDGYCDGDRGKKRRKKWRFFKKLKIPEGSSLSLDVQLSNPNVLTGLFFQPEGIILDAVLEIPMWIDLPKYAAYMYKTYYGEDEDGKGSDEEDEEDAGEEEDPVEAIERRSFAGSERCFIYRQMEHYTAVFLHVPPTTAHHCLLRTICEIHSMLSFWSYYENASLVFELLNLILTPSLGKEDDCHQPYKRAEMTGRTKKLCYRYRKDCPISIAAIIVSNFVPSFSLRP